MTTHDDQWLERALRAAEPHLADDGFTQRVLAALPPAPAPRATRLDWVVPAAVALGSAVVASQFPLAPFLESRRGGAAAGATVAGSAAR